VIEQPLQPEAGRLSRSALWERHQGFYVREGPGVWTRNIIPRYITTNAFIAHAYAEVIAAYLQDCRETGLHSDSEEAPAFIVELGAGSGVFSFHFLQQFAEINKESNSNVSFRYVMTDISQPTIEYWQAHEQLRPFVDAGVLDFARFDALHDEELQLLVSGQRLNRDFAGGPLIFFANYLFDCLPQDAFEARGGELYECLPEADAEALLPQTDDNARQNEHIELNYRERKCSPNFYGRDDWDEILQGYSVSVRDGRFLFPVGALRCLETLGEISKGRCMLIAGDKGFHRAEAFAGQRHPDIVRHGGTFSLDVNFHALIEHARGLDARVLHGSYDAPHLNVIAFVSGLNPMRHTEKAFKRHIIDYGPEDFFNTMHDATRNAGSMSLEAITSLLRLSRFDPIVLVNCYERLVQILPSASDMERLAFDDARRSVEEGWFRVDAELNPDFFFGTLAGAMEKYEESIAYFRRAQALCDSAGAEHNLGLTYLMMEDLETAGRCFARAHALDEQMSQAALMSQKIKLWPQADTAGGPRLGQLENDSVIRELQYNSDIVLEPLLPHHAKAFYGHATPEILNLARLPAFQNVEDVRRWIRSLVSEARNYSFAITHNVHGFVGVVSLQQVRGRSARFFTWVGKQFTGRGYATASLCRLIRFAVGRLSLDEFFTCVIPSNERSARLLLRLGFRRVDMPDDEELRYYYNGINRLSDAETTEHLKRVLSSDKQKIIVKHLTLEKEV